MFFKKKMDVKEYVTGSLNALFSAEREKVWEQLRKSCNDHALSGIDRMTYINHVRAIMIELVLIAITKNFNMDIGTDARFCAMNYFKNHSASHIEKIGGTYNQAFGASRGDGVMGMIDSFSNQLTGGNLRQDTIQRLYGEFYAVLNSLFNDFKDIKLTTKLG
jgi:hypothetical protein